MNARLFAACCLGSANPHAEWEPCPLAMEEEANIFAAHLLMPEDLLAPWIAKNPGSIDDDNWVDRCANKFKVPKGLVCFRLMGAGK